MKTVDWEKIENVFSTALALDKQERLGYLEHACANDDRMLHEVGSLIEAFEKNSSFIDQPCRDLGLKAFIGDSKELKAGDRLGSFEIQQLLGEGGMGRVFLARDLRLGRLVALKLLTDPFLDDAGAERQVINEARATALLDHPNICSVYGLEEIDDHRVIVMQYVSGQTLAEILRVEEFEREALFRTAVQITEAISAAHKRDIVHCDIKPGNIMRDLDGQIKVLDFGVAKIIHRRNASEGMEEYLTRKSKNGLIQGTVAYMSPEQLRGEELDLRTDIFSLGALLFELATGTNPFSRKSDAETISSILSGRSPVDSPEARDVPKELRPILRKCLAKDKENRYQSADELLSDLKNPRGMAARHFARLHTVLALALVILIAVAIVFMLTRKPDAYRMAILPFRNETSEAANEYIGDGITEGLIRKLSGSDRLRLTPFTAVTGYRGENVDHLSAGRETGADLVVTGSVSRNNDSFRIVTNVLDTKRGVVIQNWVDDVPLDDPLSFQMDMANRMTALLAVDSSQLTEAARRGSTTENPEAFRQFLIGRYYWKKRDEQNLQIAVTAFQKAIELDPGYGRPYAGLADSYVLLSLVAYGKVPTRETMAKARAAAKQALEINHYDAEAHTSLGIVLTKHDWNWSEAEREFRVAAETDPDYAAAHYWLSDLLAVTGRAEESIKEAERARELDPFSQQSEMNLARTYYYAREYDKAKEVLSRASGEEKVDKKVRYMLGLVEIQKANYFEALTIFQEIAAENKLFAAAPLGYTYAKLGMKNEALRVVKDLKESATDGRIPSEQIAFIYAALGDNQNAFLHLNAAYADRNAVLIALKVEPLFDPIRSDARFIELLKKMSLI